MQWVHGAIESDSCHLITVSNFHDSVGFSRYLVWWFLLLILPGESRPLAVTAASLGVL